MVLSEYTYVFAIGTCFALLEAYNNGANDVANAWATSVSSRSITYRWAMVLGTVFEMLGAITVGARTASTIKNGIIPLEGFQGNAGVQLLAFACASAGASLWVMWCTRHSAHVSSTYSLISSLAGVGVATVGASHVEWGWNGGKGLGAIFAGLFMAPAGSALAGAVIFSLIKVTVHTRQRPVAWAVWSSPFFFLLAGTICSLSIVYKGSPRLGLADKPAWFIATVTLGVGFGLFILSALFFVPWAHSKVIKNDYTVRLHDIYKGPMLFKRPAPADASEAQVPNYAVVQHDEEDEHDAPEEPAEQNTDYEGKLRSGSNSNNINSRSTSSSNLGAEGDTANAQNQPSTSNADPEKGASQVQPSEEDYKKLTKLSQEKFHARLRKKSGALGWAMRTLHANPMGAGSLYERHNVIAFFKRIPPMIVVAGLYGINYDIHAAQTGIQNTPEGRRMERVYEHATKYPNEVEHLYSFIQIITACTASFAHGANDVGNAVGPWAVMYACWSSGFPAKEKADVPLWQIAVISGTISLGLITYGYNIMKVMGNKITYHSPSRGSSMEMGAAITVLIFSQYSLPVSTSMCITGATVGVGLCNGTFKAVNWQRVGLLVFSWMMTIPVAGLIGGIMMGLFLNAPHFSS